MSTKIALVGAHSTGKTVVYEKLKESNIDFEFVDESISKIVNYGFPVHIGGTDATQLAIANLHLINILSDRNQIYDRGFLDLLVYTNSVPGISISTKWFIEDLWLNIKDRFTHYVYFPIEFPIVDNGIRSMDEAWRKEVDDKFTSYLKRDVGNYLSVSGTPDERVKQILQYIS